MGLDSIARQQLTHVDEISGSESECEKLGLDDNDEIGGGDTNR